MESMERHDILQPVIVVRHGESFELVAGFRRVKAALMRNERTVAANIVDKLSDKDIAWVRLTENVVRKELSTHELIEAVDAMIATDPTLNYAKIAQIIGKQASWLYNKRRAYEGAKALMEKGFEEETIRALKDTELRSLSRQKQPKMKKHKTRGDKEYEEMKAMEAYQILFDGPLKVIVVCRDSGIRRKVLRCLFDNVMRWEQPDPKPIPVQIPKVTNRGIGA